jgi:hypothetical protein
MAPKVRFRHTVLKLIFSDAKYFSVAAKFNRQNDQVIGQNFESLPLGVKTLARSEHSLLKASFGQRMG